MFSEILFNRAVPAFGRTSVSSLGGPQAQNPSWRIRSYTGKHARTVVLYRHELHLIFTVISSPGKE